MIFSYLPEFSYKNHFVQTCRTFYVTSNTQLYKEATSSPGAALRRLFNPHFTGALDIRRDCKHRKSLMNRLLDAGLSVDHECADGRTLLMLAEENNDLLMMALLLDRGANVNARLDTDRYHKSPGVRGVHPGSALLNAVDAKRPAAARLLMQYGADLEAVDEMFGDTPLTWAVYRNSVEIVKDLLFFGAGVDTMSHRPLHGRGECTPLHLALSRPVYSPNLKIVRALLGHGANVNLKLWQGGSPLAKVRSRMKTIHPRYRMTLERVEDLLLQSGAQP
jgi:ankyrin repeat protein